MEKNHINKETMRSELIRKTLLFLTVGVLLGTMATFFGEAHGEYGLTKSQSKQCEHLYFSYKKFGEQEFLIKFTFKTFIKQCIKLYKDPIWTFDGKDKIDRFYEKREAAKNAPLPTNDVLVSITQKYKISDSRYVISFEACTKDKQTLSVFLIESDSDKFLATSQKLIPQNSCSTYWTNVNAKMPDSIGIQYFTDHQNYPNLTKKVLKT